MSGHIFFNDKWHGFDDGHYSGARIIELISNNKKVFLLLITICQTYFQLQN